VPPRRPVLLAELPEGFLYQPDFLSEHEESELLQTIRSLNFENFDSHGYTARRRIVEYGMEYDFSTRKATATEEFPDYLLPCRERAAQFAGIPPEALVECIVTEYPPGAPIGWHRDAPQFEIVIGVSLASTCRMRLKPYKGEGKDHLPGIGTPLHLCDPGQSQMAIPAQHHAGRRDALFDYVSDVAPVKENPYACINQDYLLPLAAVTDSAVMVLPLTVPFTVTCSPAYLSRSAALPFSV